MFKIGDFSRLSRVSVRMLRYYDENDIFKPTVVDDFTGYRYYSASQIQQINKIIILRDFGFNVIEIGSFLSADKQKQEIMLQNRQEQIKQSIDKEKLKLNMITSAINNLFKESIIMEYKTEIKSIKSMKVIALRDIIPSYRDEGMLWHKIGEYVEQNKIAVTENCFAVYYDEECKEKDVDVEVLMEVKKLGKDDGDIKYRQTEPIEKAVCILIPGDYANIAPAFEYLGKFIEEKGYEMSGNMRQVPIKGPWNEKDVNNYLTEIQCPIR